MYRIIANRNEVKHTFVGYTTLSRQFLKWFTCRPILKPKRVFGWGFKRKTSAFLLFQKIPKPQAARQSSTPEHKRRRLPTPWNVIREILRFFSNSKSSRRCTNHFQAGNHQARIAIEEDAPCTGPWIEQFIRFSLTPNRPKTRQVPFSRITIKSWAPREKTPFGLDFDSRNS